MNRLLVSNLAAIAVLGIAAIGLALVPAPAYPSASDSAEEAIDAFKLAKFPLSERYFHATLAQDPRNFRANYGYGLELFEQHRYSEALPLLKTAVQVEPDDLNALITLGAAYQDAMNLPAAHDVYAKLLEAHPDNTKVLNNLGLLDLDLRQYDEARKLLTRYLELSPKASDAAFVQSKLHTLATLHLNSKSPK